MMVSDDEQEEIKQWERWADHHQNIGNKKTSRGEANAPYDNKKMRRTGMLTKSIPLDLVKNVNTIHYSALMFVRWWHDNKRSCCRNSESRSDKFNSFVDKQRGFSNVTNKKGRVSNIYSITSHCIITFSSQDLNVWKWKKGHSSHGVTVLPKMICSIRCHVRLWHMASCRPRRAIASRSSGWLM